MEQVIFVEPAFGYPHIQKLLHSEEDVELNFVSKKGNIHQEEAFCRMLTSEIMNNNHHIILNGERLLKNALWPSQVLNKTHQDLSWTNLDINMHHIINDAILKTTGSEKDLVDYKNFKFSYSKFKQILAKFVKRIEKLYSQKRLCYKKLYMKYPNTGNGDLMFTQKGQHEFVFNVLYEGKVNRHKLWVHIPEELLQKEKDIFDIISEEFSGYIYLEREEEIQYQKESDYAYCHIQAYNPELDGKPNLDFRLIVKAYRKKTQNTKGYKPQKYTLFVNYLSLQRDEEVKMINRIFGIIDSDIIKFINNSIIVSQLNNETLEINKDVPTSGMSLAISNFEYIKNLIIQLDYDVIFTSDLEEINKTIQDMLMLLKEDKKFWLFAIRKMVLWKRECMLKEPLYESSTKDSAEDTAEEIE